MEPLPDGSGRISKPLLLLLLFRPTATRRLDSTPDPRVHPLGLGAWPCLTPILNLILHIVHQVGSLCPLRKQRRVQRHLRDPLLPIPSPPPTSQSRSPPQDGNPSTKSTTKRKKNLKKDKKIQSDLPFIMLLFLLLFLLLPLPLESSPLEVVVPSGSVDAVENIRRPFPQLILSCNNLHRLL